MTKAPAPRENSEVTKRLVALRYAISGASQTAFAARIGIEVRRWNNFERGSPLSKEVAFLLVQKFPGVSLDWLYLGKIETLPLALREDIAAAEKATTSPEPRPGARA